MSVVVALAVVLAPLNTMMSVLALVVPPFMMKLPLAVVAVAFVFVRLAR